VIPTEQFIAMQDMPSQEDLQRDGRLVRFSPSLGDAVFVSHQWCGTRHPDPSGAQLRVLQRALGNIAEGRIQVRLHWMEQWRQSSSLAEKAADGARKFDDGLALEICKSFEAGQLTEADNRNIRFGFVWYDYFSFPQTKTSAEVSAAMCSLPLYVELAKYFLILAPPVQHANDGSTLSYAQWRSRGWCRMERVARFLSAASRQAILVQAEERVSLVGLQDALNDPPGKGCFTDPCDRELLAPVLAALILRKVHEQLLARDIHGFRVLLGVRRQLMAGLPSDPDEIRPGGVMRDGEASLDAFMRLYGLEGPFVLCRDGWMPVHYAAASGNALVLRALLEAKVSVDSPTTRADSQHLVEMGSSALIVAAIFHAGRGGAEALLDGRAAIDSTCSAGSTALMACAAVNNEEVMELLLERRADLELRNRADCTALFNAVMMGHENLVECLLTAGASTQPNMYSLNPLHQAALSPEGSAGAAIVTMLAFARCDTRQRVRLPPHSPLGLLSHCATLAQRAGQGGEFVSLCHHLPGSMPLHLALLLGHAAVVDALVEVGAEEWLAHASGVASEAAVIPAITAELAAETSPRVAFQLPVEALKTEEGAAHLPMKLTLQHPGDAPEGPSVTPRTPRLVLSKWL